MNSAGRLTWISATPWLALLAAAAALVFWLNLEPTQPLALREPGADKQPSGRDLPYSNPILAGQLIAGPGQAVPLPGLWPQFRGPARDGISSETVSLARSWDAGGPRQLWKVEVGEGYAGAAIQEGRVYLMDYDRKNKQDALRCLSLAEGKEIWRFAYPINVKRNHGMSRTVPTVTDQYLLAMGPKCHVVCLDPISGQLHWGIDLVREYGTTVPEWYTGQCPLVDDDKVILAPGGPEALLLALKIDSGQVLWKTPNPKNWKMTHASIMPMEFAGQRFYVYCASRGVVGVSATDGSLLWENDEWKISIATVPSPVPLEDGRIFLSGGYDAGSAMLQLREENGRITVETAFKLTPDVFGATQHTPVFYQGCLYGIRPDGQFVCLDLKGNVLWASGSEHRFGLGGFLLADQLVFALDDSGKLSLFEANPEQFNLLAEAQILEGRESWGPPALAGGRLILRDLTQMVCLQVAGK